MFTYATSCFHAKPVKSALPKLGHFFLVCFFYFSNKKDSDPRGRNLK